MSSEAPAERSSASLQSENQGQGRGGRRTPRWRSLLQLVLAAGLLLIVARSVPWSDQLIFTDSVGQTTIVKGRIEGDWKSDVIRFDPAHGESLPGIGAPGGYHELTSFTRKPGGTQPGLRSWDWRPGMLTVFGELDPMGLVLAFLAFSIGQLSGITRWWRLLALAGVVTSWWNVFRLSFLGLFFNLVVPGGVTGGDFVKSVIVARENPERRTHAFLSVYVDRIIGLVVLALLAAVVVLFLGDVFAPLRVPVLLFLGAFVVGLAVYQNRALRRLVRFDHWVEKLPLGGLVKKLDEAALLYSGHPVQIGVAVLFSLVNNVSVILGCLALGRAFGDAMPTGNYFAAVPIANAISALPGFPGGWGIGEAAFGTLFGLVGGAATIGVAVSVTFRLAMMAYGLCGGLFLLVPSSGLSWKQIEELERAPGV